MIGERERLPHTFRSHYFGGQAEVPQGQPIHSAVRVTSANRRVDFPGPDIVQAQVSDGLEVTIPKAAAHANHDVAGRNGGNRLDADGPICCSRSSRKLRESIERPSPRSIELP